MRSLLLIASLLLLPGLHTAQARAGEIAGKIRKPTGEAVAGVRVMATAEPETGEMIALSGIAETDREGRYRIEGLPPGRYRVMAGSLDSPVYYPGVVLDSGAGSVTVTAGATTSGVDFVFVPTPFTISGRFVWEDGSAPGPGVSLTLSGSRQFRSMVDPADGHFRFLNVPSGEYSIAVGGFSSGFKSPVSVPDRPRVKAFLNPEALTVLADVSDWVIHAARTQVVLGAVNVEGGGPAPPFELVLTGRVSLTVKVDTAFRIEAPAGEYRVTPNGLPPGMQLNAEAPLTLTISDSPSFLNLTLVQTSPQFPDPHDY